MRIVIDLQGAQSESRTRGIGRYSFAFAQGIARNRGDHEVLLALNGLFPETVEPIRRAFRNLLPSENIRVWEVPGPVRALDPANGARRRRAEVIYKAFLASLNPDIVHVTSLFEGFVDDVTTSTGALELGFPMSVTLYDLIPLHDPARFLEPNPALKSWYFEKLEQLKKSDLLLAISDFAARDARRALALPKDRVINVSTACADFFRQAHIPDRERAALLSRLGIDLPFIITSGTLEPHKNLAGLFRAFATLPDVLRQTHRLVLVGQVLDRQRPIFAEMLRDAGLVDSDLVITGHISDDDLAALYNLCELMVLPSMDEGFGLPALEAMACGAPTIGSNAASIPEVIGRYDALFDPHDTTDMARLIAHTLNDAAFREALKAHGRKQARNFSWDNTAERALSAMEVLVQNKRASRLAPKQAAASARRLKLAFVSPLPPERTGIADYSAELLPALAQHYEITLITEQQGTDGELIGTEFAIHDSRWLRENAAQFDRVLYQMGNSPFHAYMLSLMREVPGVLVLHDFFLGGLYSWLELTGREEGGWGRALYENHGYLALRDRVRDSESAKLGYPVNLDVLRAARGVIVHSQYSRRLADEWLGGGFSRAWRVIPQLRKLAPLPEPASARVRLGIPEDAFVVCSFGFLDSVKLNHRLLEAFLSSSLADDPKCHLVFVGENSGSDYGVTLVKRIQASGHSKRIRITGWADRELFQQYLAAADVAVQLRTSSRGETSRTILDSMAAGLPLVLNANGSFAEVPEDAAVILEDEFVDADLVAALEALRADKGRRAALGARARHTIIEHHAPEICACQYAHAIEEFNVEGQVGLQATIDALVAINPALRQEEMPAYSMSLATTFPDKRNKRQLLLDVTATRSNGLKTGIERVARALTMALLASAPKGYRIEPVFLSCEDGVWRHRYARQFTLGLLNCPQNLLQDDLVEVQPGDILVNLDMSGRAFIDANTQGIFKKYRNKGVAVHSVVFDLLPRRKPQHFPPGSDGEFNRWLDAILEQDGALCISRATAEDLQRAIIEDGGKEQPFQINWFHQGADLDNSAPTRGVPDNAEGLLTKIKARPSFLMVGTIEPRKGHLQTLRAFERLWRGGCELNLVVVGAEGWKGLSYSERRTIPEIVERFHTSPELNKRLFWLEGISDEYLEKIYEVSTCLIAASEGEGFGLPLIEAARHKIPILARDIPVFREVAAGYAAYFSGLEPSDLADAVRDWLALFQEGQHPKSDDMPWITWKESAQQMMHALLGGNGDIEAPSAESSTQKDPVMAADD